MIKQSDLKSDKGSGMGHDTKFPLETSYYSRINKLLFVFEALRIKPRAFRMLDKCSAITPAQKKWF